MKKILLIIVLFMSSPLLAENTLSVGLVANNMTEPMAIVSNFISTASIIVGVCCLFSAALRYPDYRINPISTPFTSIIFLLLLGAAFIGLPLISKMAGSGAEYLHPKSTIQQEKTS